MWYVDDNKQKNYCLGAKKLIDNNIFSSNGEKYCLLVVVTIHFSMFWCKSVIFDLRNNNNNNDV